MPPVRSSGSGPGPSRSGSPGTWPTAGRIREQSSTTWDTATASTLPAIPNWHRIDSRISGLTDPPGDPELPPQADGIFGGLGLQPQLREAFPWDSAPRYWLRDRDRIFSHEF